MTPFQKWFEDWRMSLLMQPIYILLIPFYGIAMMLQTMFGQDDRQRLERTMKMLRERDGNDFWETLAPTKRSRRSRW